VIVLRALQRDPASRQASAAEVLRALERLADRTASRGQLLDWLGQSLPDVFDGGDTQVDPVITDVTQLDMIVEETQLVTALPPPRFAIPWRRLLAVALTWFGLLWIALADRLRHVTSRVRAIRNGALRPSALPPPVPTKSASAHGTIS
jgi:hypothetical protein